MPAGMVPTMKTWLALLLSAAIAAAWCGQPLAAAQPKGKDGKAAKKSAAEKKEPKIEGLEISRGEKGFLGIEVADGKFKLNFYDKEKEPMKPDVARAALRWDPKYKVGMERVVLTPGAENVLTSERFIRPPYNFKLFIVLVNDTAAGEDPVGETYTIDFRQ